MYLIDVRDSKWAYIREMLNGALYYAQEEGKEKGAAKARASLELNVHLATGTVDWAVAADNGSGNMETLATGSVRA